MTDEREQPDLDAEWEGLARFLAGESGPDEERRIREALASDAERTALVNALDAALAPPVETPLSSREVEAALASVMKRRDLPADAAPPAEAIPLRPRPTAEIAQLRSRGRGAGRRCSSGRRAGVGRPIALIPDRGRRGRHPQARRRLHRRPGSIEPSRAGWRL